MRIAELTGAQRAVARAPGYAMVAVAVLALAIGATLDLTGRTEPARLAHGNAVETARSEFSTIAARLGQEFPGASTGWLVIVQPIVDCVLGDAGKRIYLLLGDAAAAAGVILAWRAARIDPTRAWWEE